MMINEDDWFSNPLDSMPIARDKGKGEYITDEYAPCDVEYDLENPDDSDQIESEKSYQSRHKSTPDHEKGAEEIVTMHEKMYRMATAKYNPFAIGGSESVQDFQGGSENASGI